MENLLFSLNATMPVFLLVLLGMLFRRLGWLDRDLAGRMNNFVFQIALPVLVFHDLASADIRQIWDGRFVLFCAVVTLLSIGLVWLISRLFDRSIQGEFIQASYRSSAAILGIALTQNIYGNAGMSPLMIIGSVPLYNIAAVTILALCKPQREPIGKKVLLQTGKSIITNPILVGIMAGLVWVLLDLPMPAMLDKTLSSLGGVATPLGLMSMGACLEIRSASSQLRPALVATFIKLVGLCALFLPVAIAMGFRQQSLASILIMLGSATAVASYVMARNMGHDGSLSACVVTLTTLLSGFTITGWLWLLRSLSLL